MLDAMEGQGAAAGGAARGGASEPAWRHEFRPPTCAEQAAVLVGGLVRRGGWVHNQEHRLKYMQVRACDVVEGGGGAGGVWEDPWEYRRWLVF